MPALRVQVDTDALAAELKSGRLPAARDMTARGRCRRDTRCASALGRIISPRMAGSLPPPRLPIHVVAAKIRAVLGGEHLASSPKRILAKGWPSISRDEFSPTAPVPALACACGKEGTIAEFGLGLRGED